MSASRVTCVPWERDGLDMEVTVSVGPSSPGSWEEAPEGPEVEVEAVFEAESGTQRPELVSVAQANEALMRLAIEYAAEDVDSRREDAAEAAAERAWG